MLIDDNLRLLGQTEKLLRDLDDELFTRGNPALSLSSVGSHVRHCIDAYSCLLALTNGSQVDYDARERDAKVEADRRHALDKLVETRNSLGKLPAVDTSVEVHMGTSKEEGTAIWTTSTLARELQFLLSHTVHHLAIIAVLLRSLGFEPDPELGVAPSTLRYWEEQRLCAP